MLELLFVEYRYLLQYAAFVALACCAWWFGDAPERRIGLIFIAAIVFEIIHHALVDPGDGSSLEPIHALLDLAIFIALAPIAMRANRTYPLWILAAQLIALLMHFEREILEGMEPLAYWVLIRVPSWLQIAAFALGLMACRRRRRSGNFAKPWRRSSDR